MPILHVKVSATPSAELTEKINTLLLGITSRILKKKPELTAIAIDYIPREQWSIGGVSLQALGKHSMYFDIRITDETNTKDEKAQYIAQAHAGFKALLGDLDERSYVHIHDVRASAYGYGGWTQEHRYHHA